MSTTKFIMATELTTFHSLDGEPALKRRASMGNKGSISPTKKSPNPFKITKPGKR